MAVIIIAGQTKNVGKTTLVCNIIAAFPNVSWTAVKISNHPHIPQEARKLSEGSGWSIWQQNSPRDHNDTARFLGSGAACSLLVQSDNSSLEPACAALSHELASAKNVIVESASAAEFLHHDLLLILLDAAQDDFKASVKRQLDRADTFLLRNADLGVNAQIDRANQTPIFPAFPDRLDPRLVSLVAAKVGSLPQAARSG